MEVWEYGADGEWDNHSPRSARRSIGRKKSCRRHRRMRRRSGPPSEHSSSSSSSSSSSMPSAQPSALDEMSSVDSFSWYYLHMMQAALGSYLPDAQFQLQPPPPPPPEQFPWNCWSTTTCLKEAIEEAGVIA
eukprot:NODE_6099_length_607_cov_11.037634_g5694_i0.p1 GENE.NODE_6099_length_607_cov_11.037634_g5694_i0~~NODE_6099_length_607_cov_11.037634_g5694_i0.p1  ORF type:complete len:132 (-),score=32.96 NODE_6099_length_607_cov_11.037634_g5694_i0:130-525(-)